MWYDNANADDIESLISGANYVGSVEPGYPQIISFCWFSPQEPNSMFEGHFPKEVRKTINKKHLLKTTIVFVRP